MSNDCYTSFCPIAKACEMIEPRWTLLVLCEMFSGATRFNEIRRGLPGISPTLLSKRLKEMEDHGLIDRAEHPITGEIAYRPTPMADELRPVVHALGRWAHRNVDADVTLQHLDARLLMWNLRRKFDPATLPSARQTVIGFVFETQRPADRDFWLVVRQGYPVDLCLIDPGHDVDLFVHADLRAITSVFLGITGIATELARGAITLTGDRRLAEAMPRWMVRTSYAEA